MACNCDGNLRTLAIVVSGMTCNHCKKAVEDAVSVLDGISKASVELDKGLLTIMYDPGKVDFTKVQNAVVKVGYEAREG